MRLERVKRLRAELPKEGPMHTTDIRLAAMLSPFPLTPPDTGHTPRLSEGRVCCVDVGPHHPARYCQINTK